MKAFILPALWVFMFAAAAMAGPSQKQTSYNIPDAKSYNAHFGNMDPNNDGKVNWQEFEAHFPKADKNVFAAIDRNKDGSIDHDEWHQFKEAYDLRHKD